MFKKFKLLAVLAVCVAATPFMASCSDDDSNNPKVVVEATGDGLFVVNSGNYGYGNASLSYYNPETKTVTNNVFYTANGQKLGDVAQSMTIHNGTGWVIVNNSHVIFAIDPVTFKEKGRITDFTSPRNIHFISDTKAYVTQLWDNRVVVVNPKTYQVSGHITVPNMTMENGSTEQMVQIGKYVYINCWSYNNRVIKIDTTTDKVVAEVTVGLQPCSLVADKNDKLWTLCDGGYYGSPYGYEAPCLMQIDPTNMAVIRTLPMELGVSVSALLTNGQRDELYWCGGDVWRMNISDASLPTTSLIKADGRWFNAMSIDPVPGDIYVADALDFTQSGVIYRYDKNGVKVDDFRVGVIPVGFCWK